MAAVDMFQRTLFSSASGKTDLGKHTSAIAFTSWFFAQCISNIAFTWHVLDMLNAPLAPQLLQYHKRVLLWLQCLYGLALLSYIGYTEYQHCHRTRSAPLIVEETVEMPTTQHQILM